MDKVKFGHVWDGSEPAPSPQPGDIAIWHSMGQWQAGVAVFRDDYPGGWNVSDPVFSACIRRLLQGCPVDNYEDYPKQFIQAQAIVQEALKDGWMIVPHDEYTFEFSLLPMEPIIPILPINNVEDIIGFGTF